MVLAHNSVKIPRELSRLCGIFLNEKYVTHESQKKKKKVLSCSRRN